MKGDVPLSKPPFVKREPEVENGQTDAAVVDVDAKDEVVLDRVLDMKVVELRGDDMVL